MTAEDTPGMRALFRDSAFRWFWGGQVVNTFGDQLFPIAVIAMTVPDAERPALILGLIMGARFSALALFVLYGGVLADRVNRFRLLAWTDVVRASCILPVAILGFDTPTWLVVVVSFVLGACEALYDPTHDAAMVSVVDPKLLARANAANKMVNSLAKVVGPAAAALVVLTVGVRTALFLDVGTFVVSVTTLAVLASRGLGATAPSEDGDEPQGSMWREALDGVRVVLGIRWLSAIQAMSVIHVLLAVAPWMVLVPVVAERDLGGIETYGMLLGAFAAGGIPGALMASRVEMRNPGLAVLGGLMPFGVSCIALATLDTSWMVMIVFFAAGFGTEFTDVVKMTAVQTQVPPEFLGRVFALDFFASFVSMPLGQLLTGLLVAPGTERGAMLFAGMVVLVTTPMMLLVPGVLSLGRRVEATAP